MHHWWSIVVWRIQSPVLKFQIFSDPSLAPVAKNCSDSSKQAAVISISTCCPYRMMLWACDIRRKRRPVHGSQSMMYESSPVEMIYVSHGYNIIVSLQAICHFWNKTTHHLKEVIVKNTADAFSVRAAVWDFFVDHVLANEDGDHHASNDHCTSQRVEYHRHRSVLAQFAW